MSLREIDDRGSLREVRALPHLDDFNRTWVKIPQEQRIRIESEVNRRLDELITSPDPNWGTITNTSIEGGRANAATGIRGDWTGTAFQAIFEACNLNEELAGMFYGNVWKKVIIERTEMWVGIRSDPTFPNRGITLQGKTYFIDRQN